MHKLLVILIALFTALTLSAETITLKTGKVVQGTVLFENDDVLVIKDANGARFQYPKSDVASRTAEAVSAAQEEAVKQETAAKAVSNGAKKLSLALEVAGGPSFLPGQKIGGMLSADLLICSHHIGARRVMLGALVGYHGALRVADNNYSFLPVAVAFRYPVLEGKHSPMVGASLGYGIGLSKDYRGGIYADINLAYRYEISNKSALYVGPCFQFQQATLHTTETRTAFNETTGETESYEFTATRGLTFMTPAIKFGIAF